jgi:hypothetical protein
MDVNYSRWMSKDPDAEPEPVEDEPRRFNIPRPAGSVVASGALVALVALGGGALVRSMVTSDVAADQAQTVGTPTAEESAASGAANIDDPTFDDSASDDSTSSTFEDDSTVSERPAPTGPRLMDRREFRRSHGVPPGRPGRVRAPRGGSTEPALPPPTLRP